MSFDWSEFLRLSESLVGATGRAPIEQSKLRTAISRAYYSAFCATRDHLADQGEIAPTGSPDDHKLVQAHLEGGDKNRRRIRGKLGPLRVRRNSADYDARISSPRRSAAWAVKIAQEIEKSLHQLKQTK